MTSTHKLFSIADALSVASIYFSLHRTRDNAVTILAVVPGERWEIDVFDDGHVDVEVFRSTGTIEGESFLTALIARHSE